MYIRTTLSWSAQKSIIIAIDILLLVKLFILIVKPFGYINRSSVKFVLRGKWTLK